MKMVLDTNVVVSALLWKGAPRQLLTASSVLVFTEASSASGFFLKKMPPCTI
jgi:predicted nucleic acid-binding protein